MTQIAKRKKILYVTVGMAIALLLAFLVYQISFNNPTYEQELKRAVKTINASCPVMVDEETRLDEVLVLPGNKIAYQYTLVHLEKHDTDVDQLEASLEPRIVADVKTNPDMQVNRDHNTTLIYRYSDKHDEILFEVTVTPELYKE